jgi:Domain of unknown function (DUF4249)
MKKIKIAYIALLIIALSSCEKVINVDLKTAESKVVIEGIIDNSGDPAKVSISKSVPFSNPNTYPTISGAVVRVTDNTGGNYLLTETSSGVYTNSMLIGVPGKTYNLNIALNGQSYTAVSKMPMPVNLDSLFQGKVILNKSTIFVSAVFNDPAGFGNKYQFIEKINGKRNKTVFLIDDLYQDGGKITNELIDEDADIKKADTVQIEMRCIEDKVFRYMKGIEDLNSGSTVPANPESNINNGALGYFSAHTAQKKNIVIK